MQALTNGKITVFGGQQTRPNIYIDDMTSVYLHFLKLGEKAQGIFNAGFENISLLEIAEQVKKNVSAEIEITESNDHRSYRQNSDKLISTGFSPNYSISDGINDVIEAYKAGKIKDASNCYNMKIMKEILGYGRNSTYV